MANTFILIDSLTVGSGGASSITLKQIGNIPNTYTDLKLFVSSRNTTNNQVIRFSFNGDTSNRSTLILYGEASTGGGTPGSVTSSNGDTRVGVTSPSVATANTFSFTEIYIPNYANTSVQKSFISNSGSESNTSDNMYNYLSEGLWESTSAITSITLTPISGDFAQYTTIYLYGIKNS